MQQRVPTTTVYDVPFPPAFAEWLAGGWQPAADRPPAVDDVAVFTAARRAAVAGDLGEAALVVAAGSQVVRANDMHYRFRPSSDFVWLTGHDDPDAVLVLDPDGGATLFVDVPTRRGSLEDYTDRNRGRVWIGPKAGPEEVAARLGLAVRPLAELEAALAGLDAIQHATEPSMAALLSERRLVKDAFEIGQLERAAAATALGFEDVVRELPRAFELGERWIAGTFDRRARTAGNDVGYETIAASGVNATVLHWWRADGPVHPGDLLLLDAGVETEAYYTADITRTMPVDGRFTSAQREVYELVLAAQQAGIDAVQPGAHWSEIQTACMRVLAAGLDDWGLLPHGAEAALDPEGQHHRRYTVCGTGHMLGLDVHDCARARREAYLDGTLQPGHVLTVEPGLYFQPDDVTVPPELRGMGVRVEDDIVVTPTGNRNLSAALPRDPDDLEAWLATR